MLGVYPHVGSKVKRYNYNSTGKCYLITGSFKPPLFLTICYTVLKLWVTNVGKLFKDLVVGIVLCYGIRWPLLYTNTLILILDTKQTIGLQVICSISFNRFFDWWDFHSVFQSPI